MELFRFIPKKARSSSEWSNNGKYVLYKKIHNLPILYVEDNIVYVFLDLRIINQVILIIKHLQELGVEFYFTHPDFSNPGEEWIESKVLYHYLFSYADKNFHKKIHKIEFDFLKNMTNWVSKFSSYHKLKEVYDKFIPVVNDNYYDYFTGNRVMNYPEHIREEFRTLWRDIQINNLL